MTYPIDGQTVNATVLEVTGTATDDDGVQEILVNGIRASSFDGFLTWRADVPLSNGSNSLVVESADKLLNRNPQAASLTVENNRIVFHKARAIAIENNTGHLYVIDMEFGNITAIDIRTGHWNVVSGGEGTRVPLIDPRRIVVNDLQTHAWILDRGYTDIIAVKLETGERSPLTGKGESLEDMKDLGLDEGNGQLLVLLTDSGATTTADTIRSGRIVSVDVKSGERHLLSDNNVPSADADAEFYISYSVLFDNVSDQLAVLQRSSILSVDPVSGQRQTLLEYHSLQPRIAALDEIGGRIVVGRAGSGSFVYELGEVDVKSGAYTTLFDDHIEIRAGASYAYEHEENRLFYTYAGKIGTLNLTTGRVVYPYY